MGILTKAARAAAAAKRAAAKAKKKAAEVAARKKAAKARVADKKQQAALDSYDDFSSDSSYFSGSGPTPKKSAPKRNKADDAARAKADKAAEGLKGSGESLSTKLRKEAKAKAAKAGPKKTGATPGKKKDTPKKAETDRKAAGQRKKDRDAKTAQATTQRKGSIAKKATVSKTDIEQAKTKRSLDAYENKVNDMPAGNIKTMLKKMIKAKRKEFEKMQAREKDMAVIKSATAARAKKMKDKVTLSRFDPKKEDKDLNRGGLAKKKKGSMYNKGGMPMVMKNGKKVPAFAADGVGKMMKGGMAKKKPTAKKKATAYMYGGMAKKKAKK